MRPSVTLFSLVCVVLLAVTFGCVEHGFGGFRVYLHSDYDELYVNGQPSNEGIGIVVDEEDEGENGDDDQDVVDDRQYGFGGFRTYNDTEEEQKSQKGNRRGNREDSGDQADPRDDEGFDAFRDYNGTDSNPNKRRRNKQGRRRDRIPDADGDERRDRVGSRDSNSEPRKKNRRRDQPCYQLDCDIICSKGNIFYKKCGQFLGKHKIVELFDKCVKLRRSQLKQFYKDTSEWCEKENYGAFKLKKACELPPVHTVAAKLVDTSCVRLNCQLLLSVDNVFWKNCGHILPIYKINKFYYECTSKSRDLLPEFFKKTAKLCAELDQGRFFQFTVCD